MEWINPRERLPEEGQLVWCLMVENRSGERSRTSGGFDSASIFMGQASMNKFGIMGVQEMHSKGYPNNHRDFYSWRYWEVLYDHESWMYGSQQDDVICSWAPYEGIPSWDPISLEESKQIIRNNKRFDDAVRLINATKGNTKFISIKDQHPEKPGRFVVITDKQMSIVDYNPVPIDVWVDGKGDKIVAWYPIPDSYRK